LELSTFLIHRCEKKTGFHEILSVFGPFGTHMDTSSAPPDPPGNPPPLIVRLLDRVAVAIVHVLILLATLKSRDPRERPENLLKADREQQTRIRNWEGVLEWSPQKRVGCFTGVAIGIAIGGAILWFGVK